MGVMKLMGHEVNKLLFLLGLVTIMSSIHLNIQTNLDIALFFNLRNTDEIYRQLFQMEAKKFEKLRLSLYLVFII